MRVIKIRLRVPGYKGTATCHLTAVQCKVAFPYPYLVNSGQCTQHLTQGYFIAFSLVGQQGIRKQWLDEEIDQICNETIPFLDEFEILSKIQTTLKVM